MAQQALPYTLPDIPNPEAWKRTGEMFTDLYSLQSQVISAGDARFADPVLYPTPESKVNAARLQARAELKNVVSIPAVMIPFNVDQIDYSDMGIRNIREGGIHAGGVWDAAAYGGKVSTLGYVEHAYTIREAVRACAANGGGTVDCTGFPTDAVIILATDIVGLLNEWDRTPITFIWSGHEVRVKTRQKPRSHHHHTFFGTRFVLKDENGARVTGSVFPYYTNAIDTVPAGGVVTTSGSAVVTMGTPSDSNWLKLEVGSPLHVNGFVPPLGVDKTTINVGGGIDASTTTITVASTTAFPSASDLGWPQGGRLRIENELVAYTSKDATHFFGCTRGAEGTTAAIHADAIPVQRVSYQPCVVTNISGTSITLDVTMNVTATALAVQIGHLDVSFDGVADFDGNKNPAADDASNPLGLWINGSRRVFIGPGLTFHHWDHGGWSVQACQDSVCYGKGSENGYLPGSLGAGFWVFGWSKRLTVDILQVSRCARGLQVDDRTTVGQVIDGPPEDSSFRVRHAIQMGSAGNSSSGIVVDGTRNCSIIIERASFIAGLSGCQGIALGSASQWGDTTTLPCTGNVIDCGQVDAPDGTQLGVNVSSSAGFNGANTIVSRTYRIPNNFQPLNVVWTPPAQLGLTYGVTVNTDSSRSEFFTLAVSNGTGFTIANPTQLTEGRQVEYYITNTSGGAMGAVTMGSKFKLAGAFVAPATGNARVYRFRYHRSNDTLIEDFRSAADQLI